MKKIILIHILLFIFNSLGFAQVAANHTLQNGGGEGSPPANLLLAPTDKKVFWVHGLTGSPNSWRITATRYATDRKMREYRPDYVEANGMNVAAHDLGEQLYDKTEFDQASMLENNVAIGHSQGGVVLRALDREKQGSPNGMRFGAYVTVGSPNGGAPIIVSANNGETGRLMGEIVNELAAGPQSASIIAQIFSKTIEQFKEGIAEFLADAITSQFLATTAQDFAYGSRWIGDLNKASSNTPRVHIVGVETAPVHWKTISSYVLNSGAGLPFGETNDIEMEEKINQLRANYISKVDHFNSLHRRSMRSWYYTLGISSLVGVIADWDFKAKQYQRGVDWIDGFGVKWARVIGAYHDTFETITLPPRTCCLRNCEVQNCGACTANCTTQRLISTQYLNSDGIVPEPQQELAGSYKRYVARGANHSELLNHPSAQANLKLIFDGDVRNGNNVERFIVAPR